MDRREAQRMRQSQHRRQQREAGYVETLVWLPQSLRDRIDAAIEKGAFKNRSEAVQAAAALLLEKVG